MHARQRHAERPDNKKILTPAAKRKAVVYLCQVYAASQRRVCCVIGADVDPVSFITARRHPDPNAAAGAGRGPASLRLSAPAGAAAQGGDGDEPQEAPAARRNAADM